MFLGWDMGLWINVCLHTIWVLTGTGIWTIVSVQFFFGGLVLVFCLVLSGESKTAKLERDRRVARLGCLSLMIVSCFTGLPHRGKAVNVKQVWSPTPKCNMSNSDQWTLLWECICLDESIVAQILPNVYLLMPTLHARFVWNFAIDEDKFILTKHNLTIWWEWTSIQIVRTNDKVAVDQTRPSYFYGEWTDGMT